MGVWLATAAPAEAAPGQPDPSFGGDGAVRTLFLGNNPLSGAFDVAVQPDGKVVVATTVLEQLGGTEPAVLRYHPDGTLDRSFGADGGVSTDVGAFGDGYAVALQSDGKIVLGGDGVCQLSQCWVLIRYLSSGALDTSFGGGDGIVKTSFEDLGGAMYDLAIQSNGKIVAAGYRRKSGDANDDITFALARYTTSGALDTSFSSDGKRMFSFGYGDDEAEAVAVDADGRILVAGAGTENLYVTGSDFALARLHADGAFDTSFSGDGKRTTDFGPERADHAHGLAIRSDGRIVAAGGSGLEDDPKVALARYTTGGALDSSFSGDGKVTRKLGDHGGWSFDVVAMGNLIVVGGRRFEDSSHDAADWALLRYRTDGTLDPSFDGDGIVVTDLGTGSDHIHQMAVQPDGKLVVAGEYYATAGVGRYLMA
jgi:uncharacterized delta-60 repeat protein